MVGIAGVDHQAFGWCSCYAPIPPNIWLEKGCEDKERSLKPLVAKGGEGPTDRLGLFKASPRASL